MVTRPDDRPVFDNLNWHMLSSRRCCADGLMKIVARALRLLLLKDSYERVEQYQEEIICTLALDPASLR